MQSQNDSAADEPEISGWYCWGGARRKKASDSSTEAAALTVPSAPQGPGLIHLTSTAGSQAFRKEGLAAITGRPRWKSADLQNLAASRGDAACLAAAYERHGQSLLDYLWGDFSFIVIDPDAKSLLAGVDRMAQHSLYYYPVEGAVSLGSTIKAVRAHQSENTELNQQALYDYFFFHMVPSPETAYHGLKKLPAAHCLSLQAGELQVLRYWAPVFSPRTQRKFDDLCRDLRQELRNAVRHCIGDTGKTGSFLSGGLDSSSVTGMLAELTDSGCPAYAIGFDEEGYDEMKFARISARHFGVDLREYYVTPRDVLDELPRIATSYDEPFGNSSALPAYFCARRAKEDGIDRLLAGDGGDEIFAGNARYNSQQTFNLYAKIPAFLRRNILEPLVASLPQSFSIGNKAKSYIRQANIPLPDRLQTYNFLNRISPEVIFSPDFLASVDTSRPIELQRQAYNSLEIASDLNRMLYLDWQFTLADNDLRKVTKMCSVAGVQVRYPMLDDALVAFSCGVPDRWKIRHGNLRYFYKRALTGWLPDETIHKKKQGFGLPFGLWMRSYKPLNELANDSLSRLRSSGFFNGAFLDRLMDLHRNEHAAYYGELIWVLTIFDLWFHGRGNQQAPAQADSA